MVDFEHLIPGWVNRVAHPYNLPIEAGIRSEIARLTGKRYLVAVLHREYDLDGLFEQLFFDEGFHDPMEAVPHAQKVQARHMDRTMAEHPEWRPLMVPAHQCLPGKSWGPSSCCRRRPATGPGSTPGRSTWLFCRSTLTSHFRRDCSRYWTKLLS